jgi:hypothetical protein
MTPLYLPTVLGLPKPAGPEIGLLCFAPFLGIMCGREGTQGVLTNLKP